MALNKAYSLLCLIAAGFLLVVAVSIAVGQDDNPREPTISQSEESMSIKEILGMGGAVLQLAAVLVGVGIFIQKSNHQEKAIDEIKRTHEKFEEFCRIEIKEINNRCHDHMFIREDEMREARSEFGKLVESIREDFRESLKRMWEKYEKLHDIITEDRVR